MYRYPLVEGEDSQRNYNEQRTTRRQAPKVRICRRVSCWSCNGDAVNGLNTECPYNNISVIPLDGVANF